MNRQHPSSHAPQETHPEQKPAGRTYNIKTQEVGPDGQKRWKSLGRVFIRDDGTGGAVFVGEGEGEGTKQFPLFPKDDKFARRKAAAATAARPAAAAAGGETSLWG